MVVPQCCWPEACHAELVRLGALQILDHPCAGGFLGDES
jgi:hypothetical protein